MTKEPAKQKKIGRRKPATSSRTKAPRLVAAKRAGKKTAPAKVAAQKTKSDAPPSFVYPYGIGRHNDLPWQIAQFDRSLKKFSETEQETLKRAFAFARTCHDKQVRKGGTPFIVHPVRIANIISTEWSMREASIVAAALLHDVVEDTQTTIREVKDAFGDEIGKLVDGMTMWPGSETPEVYLKRVSRGPRELRIIKCADVLDNLRSWPECGTDAAEHLSRWWRQAHDFALPMAEDTVEAGAKRIREIIEDDWYLRRANMI
jgi:(p)ppGpp synthase/HD superfamily hydrolase